jgi:hypothetical protein
MRAHDTFRAQAVATVMFPLSILLAAVPGFLGWHHVFGIALIAFGVGSIPNKQMYRLTVGDVFRAFPFAITGSMFLLSPLLGLSFGLLTGVFWLVEIVLIRPAVDSDCGRPV